MKMWWNGLKNEREMKLMVNEEGDENVDKKKINWF